MEKAATSESIEESFSWKFFVIISAMHLAALAGIIFFTTKGALLTWAVSHFFFITIGASIGLHRYFSHQSFKVKTIYMDAFLHLAATLCFQGGPIYWATAHRSHHRYSEKYGDPHSAKRGFLWSHLLWLMFERPNGFSYLKSLKYSPDLRKNKLTNFFEKHYLNINLSFLLILLIGCTLCTNFSLFFFLGPVRIVSVWHCTWLINSYAHGARICTRDTQIKNSNLLCILVGGDGEHSFHHNFPNSAKHSNKRFSLDYGYATLKALKMLGLIEFR